MGRYNWNNNNITKDSSTLSSLILTIIFVIFVLIFCCCKCCFKKGRKYKLSMLDTDNNRDSRDSDTELSIGKLNPSLYMKIKYNNILFH